MRLLELTINDLGVFQGINTFSLEPKSGNIVLFGGKNGSGKTTLLDSIRLCLYGIRAIGPKPTKKDYDDFINNRIHREKKAVVQGNHASISLRFEYAQFGHHNEYLVTREWNKKRKSITEKLTVKRNGAYLKDMAEERWQDFIDDLIPPGISSLFFFDGEKIQSLASDSLSEQILGEEVKKLLGLNVVEKLQTDLDIYLYRQRKDGLLPEITAKIKESIRARDLAESEYQATRQDCSQTETDASHIRGEIGDLEIRISVESSGFGSLREKLKNDLAQTSAELIQVERSIHELSTGLLPFSLVPSLCKKLQKQLTTEAEYQQWLASQNIVKPRVNHIQEQLASPKFWDDSKSRIPAKLRSRISNQLSTLLDSVLEAPEYMSGMDIRHDVSEQERLQILSWIDQAINGLPDQLKQLTERLEGAELCKQEIETKLRKIPEDEIIKPMMDKLNQLYQQLGELEATANQQDKKLIALNNRRQEAQRQLQKTYEDLRSGEDLEKRLVLVTKVQNVLGRLLEQLTAEKIGQLEDLVVGRFNELIRKPDLLHKVSIDPQEFHVTLYNKEGKIVPNENLSAGEKQMFAIAILWALRQLSGRPFPVVIDTPLGRLDSDHRNNLVEAYFPRISHQVILFSTDTEVDKSYFEALEPYISHAYHLIYDPEIGATKTQEGYFWG
jgi:DNA sulfur modification protein DndD